MCSPNKLDEIERTIVRAETQYPISPTFKCVDEHQGFCHEADGDIALWRSVSLESHQ